MEATEEAAKKKKEAKEEVDEAKEAVDVLKKRVRKEKEEREKKEKERAERAAAKAARLVSVSLVLACSTNRPMRSPSPMWLAVTRLNKTFKNSLISCVIPPSSKNSVATFHAAY